MAFNHILAGRSVRKAKGQGGDQRLVAISPNQNRRAKIFEVRVLNIMTGSKAQRYLVFPGIQQLTNLPILGYIQLSGN
jgi:hypothetical protein